MALSGSRVPFPARWLCEQMVRTRFEVSPRVGLSRHPTGHVAGPRTFEDYDLHYVFAGKVEYEFEQRTYRLAPGKFILIPPGKSFVQRDAVNDELSTLFFAHFQPASAGLDPLQALELPIVVKAADRDEAERLCRSLAANARAHREGCPWASLHAKAQFLELFGVFLEWAFQRKKLFFDPRRTGPPWLWDVLEAIENRLAEPELDVSTLARAVHLSPSHFAHQFRRFAGTSPKHLLLRKRMERACALLVSDESLPVKQIAAACGFNDPYHFSAQFKRWTRVAPSEYRRTVVRVEDD